MDYLFLDALTNRYLKQKNNGLNKQIMYQSVLIGTNSKTACFESKMKLITNDESSQPFSQSKSIAANQTDVKNSTKIYPKKMSDDLRNELKQTYI